MASKFLALAACLSAGVEGARIARKRSQGKVPGTKFISGTPILNYHLAYGGEASLADMESGKLEGDWLVVVEAGTSDDQVQALCSLAKCKATGHPEKGGVPIFEIEGSEEDLNRVIEAGEGAVKFVEPNAEVRLIPEIAGVESSVLWGLNRIGAESRANAGSGVHVYILDTGVRATHTEFGGRVVPTVDMSLGAGVTECDGDLSCAGDAQGHGTHCAGTAAGETYGVAPAALIHSVKVLSDQGSGSWSWSTGALDWLATSGERPAVASMSLGGKGTSSSMREAVGVVVSAGVTVVVAGGNENSNACSFSPAFVPAAITVGSTTSNDERSSFSNYGSCTDIWAPGSDILSAAHDSDTGSVSFSGTSMACPHVSGAAALFLAATPNLKAGDGVLEALKANAVWHAIDDLKYGDTNVLLYVGADGPPPTPAPVPTPAPPPPHAAGCNPAFSEGPDSDDDCTCNSGTQCYENGEKGCKYSRTRYGGRMSPQWFLATCGPACECK